MNKLESFQDFLATQNIPVHLPGFVLNLALTALLGAVLGWLFVHKGRALSNRRRLARNFILIAMTTMVIITVVKSSLALSLGLVGALSIIRFRTAIKDPEELSYLFLAICVGLGFGADQRAITLIGFAATLLAICCKNLWERGKDASNLYVTVTGQGDGRPSSDAIVKVLSEHCTGLALRRMDETASEIEILFWAEFKSFDAMDKSRAALRELDSTVQVSFLDSRGIS